MNVIFTNIHVISPLDGLDDRLHLWLKNGRIAHCAKDEVETDDATERIDGRELTYMPGFFDMRVHLREPGAAQAESIGSGLAAAANGGFTGILFLPTAATPVDNVQMIEYIRNRSRGSLTDAFICAALTKERNGRDLAPLLTLKEAGAIMFSDGELPVDNADVLRRALDYVAPFDGLIADHCEERTLTEGFGMHEGNVATALGLKGYPAVAEELRIARNIMLSEYCGNCKLHIPHISTKAGVELVRAAKKRASRITCDVAPHHFTLTDEDVGAYNVNMKTNPPLRSHADVDAILEALKDGVIDCIASDHEPHSDYHKDTEFVAAPFGMNGLETSLGLAMTFLVHKAHLDMQALIRRMSLAPRELLGLPPIRIAVGEKANATIIACNEEWDFDKFRSVSKSRNTPFHGYSLKGKPKFTINGDMMATCSL